MTKPNRRVCVVVSSLLGADRKRKGFLTTNGVPSLLPGGISVILQCGRLFAKFQYLVLQGLALSIYVLTGFASWCNLALVRLERRSFFDSGIALLSGRGAVSYFVYVDVR